MYGDRRVSNMPGLEDRGSTSTKKKAFNLWFHLHIPVGTGDINSIFWGPFSYIERRIYAAEDNLLFLPFSTFSKRIHEKKSPNDNLYISISYSPTPCWKIHPSILFQTPVCFTQRGKPNQIATFVIVLYLFN
jgi:hypothetical protein